MSDCSINNMVDTTIEKIKGLVDVNTIIGETIKLDDGTVIIPVSKVSYGFASGGSEFSGKKVNNENLFGGGSGAGVTISPISPIAFLTVNRDGNIRILYAEPSSSATEKVIDLVPDMVDKIGSIIKKSDKNSKNHED